MPHCTRTGFMFASHVIVFAWLLAATWATAQSVASNRVDAHWFADNSKFWYRNDLFDDEREFIVVDCLRGSRQQAFDHSLVARQLGSEIKASQLPIESLHFDRDDGQIGIVARIPIASDGKKSKNDSPDSNSRDPKQFPDSAQSPHRTFWLWHPENKKLIPAEDQFEDAQAIPSKSIDGIRPSRTGAESELSFINRSGLPIEIFWISGAGQSQSYGKVAAGQKRSQHTFGGHRWRIVNGQGQSLGELVANDTPSEVIIDSKFEIPLLLRPERERSSTRGQAGAERQNASGLSPDGKWLAAIRDFNIVVRVVDSDVEHILSQDGREEMEYSMPAWAPDSRSLVGFRVEPGEEKEVHLIRSSPKAGGRAQLESHAYALPGDKFDRYELNLFRLPADDQGESSTLKAGDLKSIQIKPSVDRFEHERNRPRVRFSPDGERLRYEQLDRGHGRFRVIEVDLANGNARNIIDEQSPTFIWTAHTANNGFAKVNWLDKTDEILYLTEKSGWRHLFLVDAATGQESPVTSGPWVVRGVEEIDQANRKIWFKASGHLPQDPYHLHYGVVNFDGSGLTWLTEGNGQHTIEYSPDRRFIIDTYSRVDLAPVHELRRVSDGRLICELERADTRKLVQSGWQPPEVFTAKGRDGSTDIWGIICRPADFDPGRKYPVLEDIYAGPHDSHVPKSFSASKRYESLTKLGFVVVKIDGMGTANRSKAFHDVCWQNLKDAGFEDRIAWMKSAAKKYPELDLDRVGIYGTSAGGQNAAAGVLFHPEFYKVAVAACGCHDNRMDKASWNEQWMGYPVGPHYADNSNIEHAERLSGKLLLIVGEMDTNVPPESTLRFADALIRADKDFDLLVVPNAGHGMGGTYGVRRMHDFFVRHLKP